MSAKLLYRYEYAFTGLWLGGKIVTVAEDSETALKLAMDRVHAEGFDRNTLRVISVQKFRSPEIVYFDTGNY